MPTYKVWDKLNCDEEDAERIEAGSPEDAAIAYAEEDHDGWTDGLYHRCPQPILVSDDDGTVCGFDVSAEMVPHFRAAPFPSDGDRDGNQQKA